MIDAIARSQHMTFFQLIQKNVLQLDPTLVDSQLTNVTPADWLPPCAASVDLCSTHRGAIGSHHGC